MWGNKMVKTIEIRYFMKLAVVIFVTFAFIIPSPTRVSYFSDERDNPI